MYLKKKTKTLNPDLKRLKHSAQNTSVKKGINFRSDEQSRA